MSITQTDDQIGGVHGATMYNGLGLGLGLALFIRSLKDMKN